MSFTKKDLRTGMFGVMNNGIRFVIVDDLIVYQAGGCNQVSFLKNDLSFGRGTYISKLTTVARSFNMLKDNISFIYDRDRDTVTEMTWEQIKEKLGVQNLKIVKENEQND